MQKYYKLVSRDKMITFMITKMLQYHYDGVLQKWTWI